MTPLVDLAFLLLSFFILTTSLRRIEAIDLMAPIGSGKPADNTLTLLLSGRDSIFGYAGAFDPDSTRIKRIGLDQVRIALHAVKDTATFTCAIKTIATAKYQNVIGVVDELDLLKMRHYSIADTMSDGERSAIAMAIP